MLSFKRLKIKHLTQNQKYLVSNQLHLNFFGLRACGQSEKLSH